MMNILDCLEYGAGSCRNEDLIDKLIARAEAAELELSQERFMRQAAEAENARLHVALEAIDAARAKATAEIEAVHQHLDECFVNDPDEGRAVPLIDRVVLMVSQIARDSSENERLREQVEILKHSKCSVCDQGANRLLDAVVCDNCYEDRIA